MRREHDYDLEQETGMSAPQAAPPQTFDLRRVVRATKVPWSRALMPVFEAIANALDAVVARSGPGDVRVRVIRERTNEPLLPKQRQTGKITGFEITDDGVGFTDANVASFLNFCSPAKEAQGGKGVGRFTWFTVFQTVDIVSHFDVGDGIRSRRWQYRDGDAQFGPWEEVPTIQSGPGTVVTLGAFRKQYQGHVRTPKGTETIAYRILEHFLARQVLGQMPRLTVADGDEAFDLAEICSKLVAASEVARCAVGEETIEVRLLLLRHHSELPGCISFCAALREVESVDPAAVVPDVPDAFEDTDGARVSFRAYVSGSLFEENHDPYRLNFRFDRESAGTRRLFDDLPAWQDIYEALRAPCEAFVGKFIGSARKQRDDRVIRHIEEHPWYRGLAIARPEVPSAISVNATEEAIELALYRESIRWRHDTHDRGARILEELKSEGEDFDQMGEKLWEQQQSLGAEASDDLARYVMHRRAVLAWLEKYLGYIKGKKDHVHEKVAHDLFFRRRANSDTPEGAYYQHNLWLIDDQLAFHHYAVADTEISAREGDQSGSARRPDVGVFQRGLSTERGDDDLACRRVTIIEFKKPGRETYGSKDDPIDQIREYAELIAKNTERDANGRLINVDAGTRYYGYVIADPADDIQWFCKKHDMALLANGWGWGRPFTNSPPTVYVEVLSFDHILKMAERRNRAFFDLLGIKGPLPRA